MLNFLVLNSLQHFVFIKLSEVNIRSNIINSTFILTSFPELVYTETCYVTLLTCFTVVLVLLLIIVKMLLVLRLGRRLFRCNLADSFENGKIIHKRILIQTKKLIGYLILSTDILGIMSSIESDTLI